MEACIISRGTPPTPPSQRGSSVLNEQVSALAWNSVVVVVGGGGGVGGDVGVGVGVGGVVVVVGAVAVNTSAASAAALYCISSKNGHWYR